MGVVRQVSGESRSGVLSWERLAVALSCSLFFILFFYASRRPAPEPPHFLERGRGGCSLFVQELQQDLRGAQTKADEGTQPGERMLNAHVSESISA